MTTVSPAAYVEIPVGSAAPENSSSSPAWEFYRKYGKSMVGVPGLHSLRWSAGPDANQVTLNFTDQRSMNIGNAILEQSIDGVELLRTTRDGDTQPGGKVTNAEAVRGIAAMRGVWDFEFANTPPWADGRVTFKTINRETTQLLDPIIRNVLPGFTRKDGTELKFHVHWRSGVPQNQ